MNRDPFPPVRLGLERERRHAEWRAEPWNDFPDPEEGWIPGPTIIGPPAPYSRQGAEMTAARLAKLPALDLAELEGRLLARQSRRAIAKRFGVHPRAIKAFKTNWFDIDGRPTFVLLLEAVPSPKTDSFEIGWLLMGCLGDDPCVQIRYVGLMHGVAVMERLLEVLRDPDREFDLTTREGLEAAKRHFRTKVWLAVRSKQFGDPDWETKGNVFLRLQRQAFPRKEAIWRPLGLDPASWVSGRDESLESALDELEPCPKLPCGNVPPESRRHRDERESEFEALWAALNLADRYAATTKPTMAS